MTDEQRPRASAKEVFRYHGAWTIGLLIWEIWCIRDGWFRPGYEHIAFSKSMAVISAPALLFCAIMAISAGLTLLRQRHQPPPPPADDTGTPPEN